MAGAARRDRCRVCDKRFPDPGQLSKRGLCARCGIKLATDSARQLAAKEGPHYDRWREGMRRAAGA